MLTFIVLFLALTLDQLVGEPRRWHPLVGFGRWATWVEKAAFKQVDLLGLGDVGTKLLGVLALSIVILPIVIAVVLGMQAFETDSYTSALLASILLYLTIGAKSLKEHAIAVVEPLEKNDIEQARLHLSYIVSRETDELSEEDIVKGSIESVLENGADAVFAAIFWFLVAGIPGAVAYRLINTMDAMWGYRNERFFYFGWAAARLDDVVNYIPSRLCAFGYAAVGRYQQAIHCWREQAKAWDSPNAGPVMASGAGALNVLLGGSATYHGEVHERPVLGEGVQADRTDIYRAVELVERAILVWLVTAFCIAGFGLL